MKKNLQLNQESNSMLLQSFKNERKMIEMIYQWNDLVIACIDRSVQII